MKEYLKPEVELIAFRAQEAIANEDEEIGGDIGLTSSPFDD